MLYNNYEQIKKEGAIMKKSAIILSSVLLTVMLILSCSAASLMPGDMNGDGKITASDARSVLRIAAKLDKVSDELLKAADVNNDGEVRASDARIVLRVAAQLETLPGREEPTTGKEPTTTEQPSEEPTTDEKTNGDEQKIPPEIQIFLGGTFTLTGNISSSDSPDPLNTLLICDGTIMRMDSITGELAFGILADSSTETAYVINPPKNIYTQLSYTLMQTLGIYDSFASDLFTSAGSDEEDPDPVISYGTLNGQKSVIYTYIYSDSKVEFITINGKVAVLNNYTIDDELETHIEITSISGQIDRNMLTLDSMKAVNIPVFISSFFDVSYDPSDKWDREYWYDEYWANETDWSGIEETAITEDDLPEAIKLLGSNTVTIQGVAALVENYFIDMGDEYIESVNYDCNEFRYFRTPEAQKLNTYCYGTYYSLLKTKKTSLIGKEKDVSYIIDEDEGIYADYDEAFKRFTGLDESIFDSGLDALFTLGDKPFTLTKKSFTDEEGKNHVLIIYNYEDGEKHLVYLTDGEIERIETYYDSSLREIIKTNLVSGDVNESEFSLKGLKKRTALWF